MVGRPKAESENLCNCTLSTVTYSKIGEDTSLATALIAWQLSTRQSVINGLPNGPKTARGVNLKSRNRLFCATPLENSKSTPLPRPD
jgi:hypothetical protein